MYGKCDTDRAGPDGTRPQSRGRTRTRPHDNRALPDRMYNRCRVHDPIFVTSGPPLPEHMLAHTCKVAVNMQAGRYERRPTFVLGMRAGDASTQKLATRIVRGFVEPLRDDSVALLKYWDTDRSETCKALSIFQVVQDSYALEPGRPWTLWAFQHMWDQRPQELTSVADVLMFLEGRLRELQAGDQSSTPMLPPGMKLPSDFGYEDSRLIMHFVVEVSPTWPKLFKVTYGDDDDEDEEDEEEASIKIEVERRKLEWKEKGERAAMKEAQKRSGVTGKGVERKTVEKKEEKKEAERKEAERKERIKRREREKREEREKKEEKDKKENEERKKARERRREREKQEQRERERERREEWERRETERERRRERQLREEKERQDTRERERQRDRLRERTLEKKILIRSHGQVSIGTTTSTTPSIRAFLRGQVTR